MKLLVSTTAPYYWLKVDKTGKPVEKGQFGEAAFFNTITKEVTSVMGVAPANAITFHEVDIPTNKRATMIAAVPFALEESLSEDLDELHFTVMDWSPNALAHVAVVAKNDLQRWVALFLDAHIELDAIIPEYALLPIHPDCDATIVRQAENSFAVKATLFSGIQCDEEALEYWWSDDENRQLNFAVNDQELAKKLKTNGGENINFWPIGNDFRGWLEHAPNLLNAAPSLLHGEYEAEHLKPKTTWLYAAAGIATFALLLLGASHWFEVGKLQARYDKNQQEIKTLFQEMFPDEEYLDQPRRQISSLLARDGGQSNSQIFQYLLAISSEIVPANKASFEEINYREEQLQIGILAPSFAALEEITTQINAREGLQAVLISSGTRDQSVTGQIKIARGNNDA